MTNPENAQVSSNYCALLEDVAMWIRQCREDTLEHGALYGRTQHAGEHLLQRVDVAVAELRDRPAHETLTDGLRQLLTTEVLPLLDHYGELKLAGQEKQGRHTASKLRTLLNERPTPKALEQPWPWPMCKGCGNEPSACTCDRVHSAQAKTS